MGNIDIKINEYGEIIRDDGSATEEESLYLAEQSLLRGEKVEIKIRRKIARKTYNVDVLRFLSNDKSYKVREYVAKNKNTPDDVRKKLLKEIKEKQHIDTRQYNTSYEIDKDGMIITRKSEEKENNLSIGGWIIVTLATLILGGVFYMIVSMIIKSFF